jgi:hypothetical protein
MGPHPVDLQQDPGVRAAGRWALRVPDPFVEAHV